MPSSGLVLDSLHANIALIGNFCSMIIYSPRYCFNDLLVHLLAAELKFSKY